jgi:hypothetical protein
MYFDINFDNIIPELQSNSDNCAIFDGFNHNQAYNNIPTFDCDCLLFLNQSEIELSQTLNNFNKDNSSSEKFIIIDNKQFNHEKYLENNDIKNYKKIFTISSKEKALLGRKKKSENIKGKHNKFSEDNLRRKVKHLVIRSIMNYINEKIESLYKGKKSFKNKFLTLNKMQKSNADINYNKDFLNKKIGNILSDKISKKYTIHKEDHNKLLVKYLIKEKDINKKIFFNNFFNLTFLQCLKHYSGEKPIKELEGAKCFNDDKNTLENDDYILLLENYIKNYEEKIMNKNSRKKRLSIKNNNIY